ncbi:MAG: DUF6338 family protein [Candidatus Thiodiazotropha sp.]
MEIISEKILSFFAILFPGFLAAWIFYGLTSHHKPSQFERTVQALVFTFIIQVFLPIIKWALLIVGGFISLVAWNAASENIAAVIMAIALGFLLAFFTNNDKFHKLLREYGFTTRTSHPSEWFYVLSEKVTFIILHLKDGRRLYGWPKEWPIERERGQFYIMLPSWIQEDGTQLELPTLDGILIDAHDVQWVEFIQMGDEHE